MYKTCSICLKSKQYSEFGIDNNSSDGYRSECKICRRTRRKVIPSKFSINFYGSKLKKCKFCFKILPLSDFYKKGDERYESKCKNCAKKQP